MVGWMSGLVYGLQNRPRRFESATDLGAKASLMSFKDALIVFIYVNNSLTSAHCEL